MLSCVTHRNIWRRSKPSCRGCVKGKKTSNVVQIRIGWKFVHVTYAAVRDEVGEFQGVLEYVQDYSNLIGRSIRIFVEEWSKVSYETEFMESELSDQGTQVMINEWLSKKVRRF